MLHPFDKLDWTVPALLLTSPLGLLHGHWSYFIWIFHILMTFLTFNIWARQSRNNNINSLLNKKWSPTLYSEATANRVCHQGGSWVSVSITPLLIHNWTYWMQFTRTGLLINNSFCFWYLWTNDKQSGRPGFHCYICASKLDMPKQQLVRLTAEQAGTVPQLIKAWKRAKNIDVIAISANAGNYLRHSFKRRPVQQRSRSYSSC